ncbi:MAG: hypothetical protein VB071_14975 [Lawsonibacter sp.]|nr:hypothetical protein [Lawsonibacter sp.]
MVELDPAGRALPGRGFKDAGTQGGRPPWEIDHMIAGRNLFQIKVKETDGLRLKQ